MDQTLFLFFQALMFSRNIFAFNYVHSTNYVMKQQLVEKKRKNKYSRKELTLLVYQYINVCTYILHENLQSTYINFFRSLLEDLEHQSRWREVDYLDDTAEGDQNFLTPYRLVSLARELCNTGE